MNMRSLCVLAFVGSLALAPTACGEARLDCAIGHAGSYGYAVTYKLLGGTGACSKLTGDIIGVEDYHGVQSDGQTRDLTKLTVAIQTSALASLGATAAAAGDMYTDKTHKLYGLGDFAALVPDGNGFCTVPTLTPSEQSIPAIPAMAGAGGGMAGTPAQPATDVKYEWSNVRFYVTASAQGTQMIADLKYTADGCTATYQAIGVWPAVSCATTDASGNTVPSDALCNPNADPDAGLATGSGINPDFPVKCDPVLLNCVLVGMPPALNATPAQ